MTRRLTALACVLLVATAGCAGITAQDDATTTAPTQTTAETTATATTESVEQLAPGVTTDGVEDARALADAHQSALRDGGFVKHSNATRTNESVIAARNQTFAVENESLWRLTTTGEGVGVALGVTNGTYDTYADGSRVLWQLENDTAGNTSYGVMSITIDGDDQPVPPNQTFEQDTYQSLYERSHVYTLAANADSVEALDGGDGAVELSGSTSELSTRFTRSGDVEFTATVSADGLVQSIELSYPSENATVERSLSFDTDVTDPVEQPEWYETALNETDLNETTA
ncbi:hypothetical protein [Halobacterium jilantaiense]|uniref:Uncharacterized protein n=1 Tax=Halobacterium jilantaiense TaxID=355548 RepID=A0A1I0PB99_9EURY|nr:hypothetical protein [Halobacterium jilantaiense]SEW11404.1 hypothetical protein SAMN04487945_1543 [Halobacterium jilantaiense]